MSDNIPVLDPDDENFDAELHFALSTLGGASDYGNDRGRPYNGQAHTAEGTRGKTVVEGLTIRDIRDCFVRGALLSCGIDQPDLYGRVKAETWRTSDLFEIDWSQIDPLAVSQNMNCEIEKMMGIFPNCEPFDVKKWFAGISDAE